jgi:hypothetical protein
LTSIGGEDLYLLPILKDMGKKLDLLPVQRNDANLLFTDATSQQCLNNLTNKFGFDRVLHKIAHPGVRCRKSIGINEDGFAAVKKGKRSDKTMSPRVPCVYLSDARRSIQHPSA